MERMRYKGVKGLIGIREIVAIAFILLLFILVVTLFQSKVNLIGLS